MCMYVTSCGIFICSSSILFGRQIIIYKLIFTHVHTYNTNDKPPGATTRDINDHQLLPIVTVQNVSI